MSDIAYVHDCPADAPRFPGTGDEPRIDRSRQAVLLMAYGSVQSLDEVPAYYTHIRHGRPPTPELLEELLGRYRAIGGASPLSGHTERQRGAVEATLLRRDIQVPVYAAMKHIDPFIEDVVERIVDDGVTHIVAMALAPHFSTMSICTYCRAVGEARDRIETAGGRRVTFEIVRDWHAEPGFIRALAIATREALDALGPGTASGSSERSSDRRARGPRAGAHVVFTAHSLPRKILDVADPYPELLMDTARLVAESAELAGGPAPRATGPGSLSAAAAGSVGADAAGSVGATGAGPWSFAFQSAGRTADPWLGPDLTDHLRELSASGVTKVVVCPVGFVADHLEVLYDIDVEAREVADELGMELGRARSMNDDPTFISGIADVLERRLVPTPAVAAEA